MIFYCGLMVHITDTRTQKVVSYTSAHITEMVSLTENLHPPGKKNFFECNLLDWPIRLSR